MKNKELVKRILDISYRHKLSHIGSCLTALPIIEEIYSIKKKDEKFVLSSGHAHLAHAVVMEKYGIIPDAEENIKKYGIHCDRRGGCDVSTGSLGHGLPIAVGMALSEHKRKVYSLISDGECSEGSIYEALRIATEQKLPNLRVYLNFNGWGAYKRIEDMFIDFGGAVQLRETNVEQFPFLKGQDAHYAIMSDEDYNLAWSML